MSSVISQATEVLGAFIWCDYAIDTEGRETWLDEGKHRLINLIDILPAVIYGAFTLLPLIPISAMVWMGPRRLLHGYSDSLEQWSFTPLKYQATVLMTYPFVYLYLANLHVYQFMLDCAGVIAPSLGAYGRNLLHATIAEVRKELKDSPAWSWQPIYDLVAEGMARKALNYTKGE